MMMIMMIMIDHDWSRWVCVVELILDGCLIHCNIVNLDDLCDFKPDRVVLIPFKASSTFVIAPAPCWITGIYRQFYWSCVIGGNLGMPPEKKVCFGHALRSATSSFAVKSFKYNYISPCVPHITYHTVACERWALLKWRAQWFACLQAKTTGILYTVWFWSFIIIPTAEVIAVSSMSTLLKGGLCSIALPGGPGEIFRRIECE